MPRSVQTDEVIATLEIRVGAKFGPPHEGGRRGALALEGDFPMASKPWLESLRAHPLSERFGYLWVYLDGQLVSAKPDGAPAAEDPEEVRAREALLDIDAMEGDRAKREKHLERLDVKVVSLLQRAELEQRRVDVLLKESQDLEGRLVGERKRVADELALLDQQLAQARQVCSAVKMQLQQEQLQYAAGMNTLQEQVDAAFRAQLKRTTENAALQATYEEAIATSSVGRKVEAVAQTTQVVDLMKKIEESALNSLLPSGPRAPTGGEKLMNHAAEWLGEGGGFNTLAAGAGKLLNLLITQSRPPPPKG